MTRRQRLPRGLGHRRRTVTEVVAVGLGDEHLDGTDTEQPPALPAPAPNRATRRLRERAARKGVGGE
jgi:hypothetical protein